MKRAKKEENSVWVNTLYREHYKCSPEIHLGRRNPKIRNEERKNGSRTMLRTFRCQFVQCIVLNLCLFFFHFALFCFATSSLGKNFVFFVMKRLFLFRVPHRERDGKRSKIKIHRIYFSGNALCKALVLRKIAFVTAESKLSSSL